MDVSGRDMRDVVLFEVEAASPQDPAAEDGSPARRRWLHRSRWGWWLAGALALVVVANAVIADRRESSRMAALAGLPGILAPLDGPVAELWRLNGTLLGGPVEFAGRLLAVQTDGGQIDIVAVDPRTGADVWRVEASPARAMSSTNKWAPGFDGTRCAFPLPPGLSDGGSSAPAVVCVVVDESSVATDPAGLPRPTRVHLLVVDARTGAVLASGPTDPTTRVATIGTDIVSTRVDSAGRVRVARTDPLGTATRWTFTGADPVSTGALGYASGSVRVADGIINVSYIAATTSDGRDPVRSSWVLSGAGAVIRSQTSASLAGFNARMEVMPGGRQIAESATTDTGARATTITDIATGRSFTAEAFAPVAGSDDASLAGLILMATPSGSLLGYDAASGRPEWTVKGSENSGIPLIIGGQVVRASSDQLTSIDGRTGATVWTTPISSTGTGSLVTDGRVVLVPNKTKSGGPVLTAYGLDDGRPRWHTALTGDMYLLASNGRLYGLTASPDGSGMGLVALG